MLGIYFYFIKEVFLRMYNYIYLLIREYLKILFFWKLGLELDEYIFFINFFYVFVGLL